MWIGMSAIGSYLEHLKVLKPRYAENDLRDGSGKEIWTDYRKFKGGRKCETTYPG